MDPLRVHHAYSPASRGRPSGPTATVNATGVETSSRTISSASLPMSTLSPLHLLSGYESPATPFLTRPGRGEEVRSATLESAPWMSDGLGR
jgi:hypothetical protein